MAQPDVTDRTDPSEMQPSLTELVVPGPHRNVGERLAEVVRALPDSVALLDAGGELTYAELGARVQALGGELAAEDTAGERRPVGILAEQGVDSVAAMMAAMVAGFPAVVLDAALPAARLAVIAGRAGVGTVLADDARREVAEGLPGPVTVRGLLPRGGAVATPQPADLDTPASLIFTSGTTGMPKGVTWLHRTVLATAYTSLGVLRLTPADRVALVLPQAFAAGQLMIFNTLLNGGTLFVRDARVHGLADLVRWLDEARVSVVLMTPSLLRSVTDGLADGHVLTSMRALLTAGEKVWGRDVAGIRPHLPATASFFNLYGSSETDSISSFEVGPDDAPPEGIVPGGHAYALRDLDVLTPDGEPVPQGEVGVLHITSAYMSAGYWGDPEQTAGVFTPLLDGRTRFRTADRARIDENGVLHLLGRVDDAVKIRGYLVAPEEVETVLRTYPEIADCVVRAIPGTGDQLRLVAWIVAAPDQRPPSAAGVRSTLSRVLPAYMVPSDVVLLEELPVNERGKVAVRDLPHPPERPEPVPPRTDTETELEAVWARILKLEHVGRDESFTALGGDSLAVEEMLTVLGESTGVHLSTADLAEHPTLAEFAAMVDGARRGAASGNSATGRSDTLVRLRRGGDRPPVFCFAGAGGHAAFFEPLAGALGPEQPVYAFQVNGFENPGLPDWTIGSAARRYLRSIEEVAPRGPVVLVGHSLGGLFALRVAQMLGERGRQVPLVVLLDTFAPPLARTGGDALLDRVRRTRAGVVGLTLYDFLLPTSIRRRGRTAPADLDPARRPDRAYLRTRLRIVTAGIRTPSDPAERKDIFNMHGIGIAQFHRPKPWHGRTLVYQSEENHDDPRWWAALLPGEHEVRRMATIHTAVLRQPYVGDLAREVMAAVDGLVAPAGGTAS